VFAPRCRAARPSLILCAIAAIAGCLGDELPNAAIPPPPASCGNNACDPGLEDCLTCPADCPCCSAVFAAGTENVADPANSLGKPDGKAAVLNELSALTLALGGEVYNGSGDAAQADFKLDGKVTSSTSGTASGCATALQGSGAFSVHVSSNGSTFAFVGVWTQENASFDLGCAKGVTEARWIRIVGQPGATGELDAVSAASCNAGGAAP